MAPKNRIEWGSGGGASGLERKASRSTALGTMATLVRGRSRSNRSWSCFEVTAQPSKLRQACSSSARSLRQLTAL
jgi:hypothetical protein